MSQVVVEAKDVHRVYRRGAVDVPAVRGISLAVRHGDYIAILGPSGSGKSTLLNLLGGIDLPTTGAVELMGRQTDRLSDRQLTRTRLEHVGFVFQRFHLLPALTARENVELPMAELGMPGNARRRRADRLLDYVGLGHRLDHRPGELSGGEMQRVAIARALANEPEIVLADEPTGELDRETGAEIAALFRRLNGDGTTLVVVTHDPALAGPAATVRELRDGRLIEAGTSGGASAVETAPGPDAAASGSPDASTRSRPGDGETGTEDGETRAEDAETVPDGREAGAEDADTRVEDSEPRPEDGQTRSEDTR